MHLWPECHWEMQSKGSRHRHSHTASSHCWSCDTLSSSNASAPVCHVIGPHSAEHRDTCPACEAHCLMRGPVPHLPRVGSRAFCTVLPTLTARPRPSGLPRRGRRHPLGSPLPPRWLPDVAALQLESFLPHAGRVLIAVKRKLRVRLRFGDGCLDKLWLSDPTSVSVHASVDSTSGKVQAQGMAPCSRNRLLL